MGPADIAALISVGRPTIAPDGSFCIFATSRPDIAANRNVGQLWRVDLPDGLPRRLTRGVADIAPGLSPSGDRVAFLRADDKGKPQVHLVASGGGEPLQVTDADGGVSSFSWSPDGTRLSFCARVIEPGRYGSVDGLDAASEAPRRITGIRWQSNGLGSLIGRPMHVFVIDVPAVDDEPFYDPAPVVASPGEESPTRRKVATEARRLTFGDDSHSGAIFTADGREVLTVPDRVESDARDLRSRIIAVRTDGSGQRDVLSDDSTLSVSEVFVADDGAIALLAADVGESGTDFIAPGVALWLLDEGDPRRLTDPETIDLGEVGSHISQDGDDFLVQNRTRGRVELLRVSREGDVDVVLAGESEVGGHAASVASRTPGGSRIVAAVASPDSFGELVLVGTGPLTAFGAKVRDKGVVTPIELDVTARDGYAVHGWVASPEGEGPFPVILQIHGGPYASYGIHVFDETQVLVDAGYAVVYCNPRGSAGYGRAHGRSIRGRMGTIDFFDVIDFLDAALGGDARLDGDRVGIMGGSYGGYLTAWTIAHDHRFAAAIVERGFLDPISFQGTSDIGSFFGDEYVGADAESMVAQSPMAVVDRVSTPTLVMHSELDLRCPLEQATRYYTALKRQGTTAELLVFPGEDHELTRAGQPRHRVERFDAVLEWWRRHLPA